MPTLNAFPKLMLPPATFSRYERMPKKTARKAATKRTAKKTARKTAAKKTTARKSTAKKTTAKKAAASRARKTTVRKAAGKKPKGGAANDIRAWALAQGMQVSARGRVPAEVREAYEKANG